MVLHHDGVRLRVPVPVTVVSGQAGQRVDPVIENGLRLLSDNGYLEPRASESLINDCARINKILITITAKVRKRLNG